MDDNHIHRKKEDDVKSTHDADVKHEYRFQADSLEVEDGRSPTPRKVYIRDSVEMNRPTQRSSSERGKIITGGWYVGTGSTWESYLHSEYCQIADVESLQPAPLSIEDEEDDEEIPLSVAVKLWIDEEIMYQYPHQNYFSSLFDFLFCTAVINPSISMLVYQYATFSIVSIT